MARDTNTQCHLSTLIQHSTNDVEREVLYPSLRKPAPISILKANQKRINLKEQNTMLRNYRDAATEQAAPVQVPEEALDTVTTDVIPFSATTPVPTSTMLTSSVVKVSITVTNNTIDGRNHEMPNYRKFIYMALDDIKTRIAEEQQLIHALDEENKRAIIEREQLILRMKNLATIISSNNVKSERLRNRIEENEDLKAVIIDVERLSLLRLFYHLNGHRRFNNSLVNLNISDKTSTILNLLINSNALRLESPENL
ncbi:unnamed protein product [Didymodactylos carnosus]|uniref:Uncharacterized protein n=1 Tax=Didymodactylos carnosus TaxID=1234261 RepID=A0A814CQ75_9BILA|nr:unnamed protein product [Didymodactylos carnosus]CAF3720137.1 unnamed protein product [Didymodactylos carnosus]